VNLFDPPDAMERDEHLIERARVIASEGERPSPQGPRRQKLLEAISAAS